MTPKFSPKTLSIFLNSSNDNDCFSFSIRYQFIGDVPTALQISLNDLRSDNRASLICSPNPGTSTSNSLVTRTVVDSLYRWWWLLGRIYHATGKETEAIAAYRNAISSLQKIRSGIASASKEYQLNFRDKVEPVYREFMELLLSQEQPELWQEALDTFNLLQLAELESFFGDICTPVKQPLEPSQLLAQTQSLAISSIILPKKTYLVVLRPDGKIHRYPIAIRAEQFTKQIQAWRDELEDGYNWQYLKQSQAFYDLLIRPLEQDLAELNPKTLVFISDRNLRNVPMAALYDGKQYLVEKYSLAVSLGLKLISQESTSDEQKALTFGSTKAIPPFNDNLPNVAFETEEIQTIMGGDRFLNQNFTWENFRKQFLANSNEVSIVHLATHGRFSGTAERSMIQTFDRLISLSDLESLFNQSQLPINLLTLSVCQTAAGNNRSVFGLAGVAIRSGIPSLIGSLWFANDQASAELMIDFYFNLKQGLTKAEALQRAQINVSSTKIFREKRKLRQLLKVVFSLVSAMEIKSRLDLTEIFCNVDDFYQSFEKHCCSIPQLTAITGERRCSSRMSLSGAGDAPPPVK